MSLKEPQSRYIQHGAISMIVASTFALVVISSQPQGLWAPGGIHGNSSPLTFKTYYRGLKEKGRIVGGQESKPGQFPFMVSLRDGDTDWSWATCGGSLISPSIVLTAAHCIGNVRIADYNRFNQGDDTDVQRRFFNDDDIIAHEKYSHITLDYDFALIRLPEPIQNPKIVRLNDDPDTPGANAQKQRVIGWGRTEYAGDPSPVQKYADLDYVQQKECLKRFGGNYITDQMLCAYTEGQDSCQGDSGGPLITMNSDAETVQVGVVSWGSGCASEFPGVYSRVHTAVNWINEKVCTGENALAPQDCNGDVLKALSMLTSGDRDSSQATNLSGAEGKASDEQVGLPSDNSTIIMPSTNGAACADRNWFRPKRGKKVLTCEYVAMSRMARCKIYKKYCPVTCDAC